MGEFPVTVQLRDPPGINIATFFCQVTSVTVFWSNGIIIIIIFKKSKHTYIDAHAFTTNNWPEGLGSLNNNFVLPRP